MTWELNMCTKRGLGYHEMHEIGPRVIKNIELVNNAKYNKVKMC